MSAIILPLRGHSAGERWPLPSGRPDAIAAARAGTVMAGPVARFPPLVFRPPSGRATRAAYRDQVQRVGGLDPASQLLAPPRAERLMMPCFILTVPRALATVNPRQEKCLRPDRRPIRVPEDRVSS